MAFPYPQYREQVTQLRRIPVDVAVPNGSWSSWLRLMVRERDEGNLDYRNRNEGHEGLYIHENLPRSGVCGIYEWKIVNLHDAHTFVAYLGSSCNDGPSPLRNRILQYCRDGDHKHDLINYALRNNCELHVRYREYNNVQHAVNAEHYLLGWYNYAWNDQRNGIRAPLR